MPRQMNRCVPSASDLLLFAGVQPPAGLPPLDESPGSQVDYQQVAATRDRTLEPIRESDLLQFS